MKKIIIESTEINKEELLKLKERSIINKITLLNLFKLKNKILNKNVFCIIQETLFLYY